jgi:long-chain acyl-CoA synthetase
MDYIAQTFGVGKLGMEEIRKLLQDVVRGVNQALPAYKRIHHTILRETEFIKTTTKKIKRYLEKPA